MLTRFFTSPEKPHSSVVIDVYKKHCTGNPVADNVLFGIKGCEDCLQDAIAQALATDERFALFLKGAYEKAAKLFEHGTNEGTTPGNQ